MNPDRLARRLAEASARRATAVVWGTAALVTVSVLLALGLETSASPGTLFDGSSPASKATDRLHREFGGEPVLVLIESRREGCPGGRNCRLPDLLLTPDLIRVLSFEGCVSGNIPRRARKPAPVCEEFTEHKPFLVVNGPGTFINESARQISSRIRRQQRRSAVEVEQASEAARKIAAARGLSEAEQKRLADQARQLAQVNALEPSLRYGLNPQGAGIGDPSFVHQLAFEPSISYDAPKTRFAQFFPNRTSAVVELRPRPGLSESERREAIDLVRTAVASPSFRLESARYTVTGEPVVALGVSSSIDDSLLVLLIAALVILTVTLALFFRSSRRLAPLAPAVGAVAITYGLMSLLGSDLTIASIAVLPVLSGASVAVATHFQRTGALPLAPAVSAAIGFAALVASPVPMVRTFGGYVAAGIVLTLVLTATFGSALLQGEVRGAGLWRRGLGALVPAGRSARRLGRGLSRPAQAIQRALAGVRRGWASLLGLVTRRPRAVLALAGAVALLGWVLAPQSDVVSGLDRLAPGDIREVEEFDALERKSGMERSVNVVVTAPDLTARGVIPWMVRFQRAALASHGYSERRPCPRADLCPAVPLADLFGRGRNLSQAQTRALLRRLPEYFTQGVISRDRRTANISFLIRRMPVSEQRDVIADLRRQLDPPAGVSAELGGRAVLAADAADFGSSGRELALIALAAIFVLLLAIYRSLRGAAVSAAPVAMAAGWSALIVAAPGVTLNPMSAAAGALVTGFGAYVAIVLSDLYRGAHTGTVSAGAAVNRAYGLGGVLVASAATAIAGFGALIVSDVQMLREFGSIAVVDLAVALAGVALVLPAAVVWTEQRRPASVAARRLLDAVGRLRRPRLPRRRSEAQRP